MATGCADVEGDDGLEERELVEIEEPCEVVPHVYHVESRDEDRWSVTVEQVTFPGCNEETEFQVTVNVDDVGMEPIDDTEPESGSGDDSAPRSATSYYLFILGQPYYVGTGSFTWTWNFIVAPYQSWGTHLGLVAVDSAFNFDHVAGAWFAYAPPYGGGGYQGPGDVVPGWRTRRGRPNPPRWQIPWGASRTTVCSGRDSSICVSGIFWDAAAQIARTQGFCPAAEGEHQQMADYANRQPWPGYPRATCVRTTGLTRDMWGSVANRCTTRPSLLACDPFGPMLNQPALVDLTTDVVSTANLWEGCRQELDRNLGGC